MARVKKTRNLLGRNLKSESKSDTLSAEARSALMGKVKSSDTKLEVKFIECLETAGITGYDLQARDLMGRPDVVFRSRKICIFVDSNFWHGWQYPRWQHKLKSEFWRTKIMKNRKRDLKVTRQLRKEGWKVIRVWEHQLLKSPENVIARVQHVLNDNDV